MAPDAVTAPGSPFFSVLRQAHELGFDRMSGDPELGGLGESPLTQQIVLEELSYGNAGLAGSILLSAFPPETAMATPNPELIEEFAAPHYAGAGKQRIGAGAITETRSRLGHTPSRAGEGAITLNLFTVLNTREGSSRLARSTIDYSAVPCTMPRTLRYRKGAQNSGASLLPRSSKKPTSTKRLASSAVDFSFMPQILDKVSGV